MNFMIKLNQSGSDYLLEVFHDDKEITPPTSDTTPMQAIINNTTSTTPHSTHTTTHDAIRQREADTFMKGSYQYYRIGEVYGKIAPDDTVIGISRSCYYSNRKKAGYGQK